MADIADKPLLQAALASRFGQVRHVCLTGSTNKDLLARPFGESAAAATLLWADHQSAGRGRRGRVWQDEAGRSLTFSVATERAIVANAVPTTAFSLVAGVVLSQTLMARLPHLNNHLLLKWPNDVLFNGGKVVGILSEMRREQSIERLVVGCGINLHAPRLTEQSVRPDALPAAGLLQPGQSLSDEATQDLVAAVALGLADAFDLYSQQGFAAFRSDWASLDAYADTAVRLSDDGRDIIHGVCRSVDENGALLIEQNGVVAPFAIGDVSARRAGVAL